MVKQKFKYIMSVILMFCIAFAFIFSTVFKITSRDIPKAFAIDVSSVEEFKAALTNGTDSEIVITQDIEVPCEKIDESAGAGNVQTAEIIINRSVTIKSGGDGTKKITRTGKDGAKNNLRSLFEVAGNGVEVTFENVVLDGGASLPVTSGRIYYTGDETVKGRSLIDVCQGSTLNVGDGCTIQNSFADSSISTHGYSNSLPCCGGAIRTDFYSDGNSVDMRGGTVNLLSGSTVKDCSTRAMDSDSVPLENYGGAVAAYDLGTINMYSGATISGCTSSNGGAIGICHGTNAPYTTGTLNIYGGSFNDCRALKGGAVNVGENSNVKDNVKFKLLATEETKFDDCHSQNGGNTFYIATGNKIYLLPNSDNSGNIKIADNCQDGSAKGSDGDNLPAEYRGYKNHIEFESGDWGSSAFNEDNLVDLNDLLGGVKIKIGPENNNTKYTAIINSDLSEDELQLKYKWYQSNDGTNWEEINGETGKEITVTNENEKPYYKVVVASDICEGEISAQTKPMDDVIQSLQISSSTSDETGKNTYTAEITYKDPENEGESVVEPKYQWYEVDSEGTETQISGETGKTYTPESDEGGKTYKVVVSSDYYKGTKEAQSDPGGVDPSNASFKVGSGDNWTYFDNLKNAFSNVSSGESIVALKDYTLTEEAVLETSDVTIDLSGHAITQTDAAKIRVRNTSGAVNISNGTLVGNLDMVADGSQSSDEYINGAVQLENTIVQGAIYNDGHPLTITSGKYGSVITNRASTSTISGGTFSGNVESSDGANIDITSGYFSGNINKSENGGEIKISGGKFVNEPDVNYIKDGFETFDDKGETVDGVYYGYEVLKQRPTESLFSIEGLTQTYDGTGKGVTVTEKNGGHEFDGKITVTYCKELDIGTDAETWTSELPIDVEFYKVKIQIAETENYSAHSFYKTLSIAKATPAANMFNFSANDAVYDGESKRAQVTFNEKYDESVPDVVHTGMGEVTLHYYKDSARIYELSNPEEEVKNVGTYYVGITVADGSNYSAQNTIIYGDSWKFEIKKIVPDVATFKFTKPDPSEGSNDIIYDRSEKKAKVIIEGASSDVNSKIKIYYKEIVSDGGEPQWTETMPKNAGTYRVGITLAENEHYETITEVLTDDSWQFIIEKAVPTVDLFYDVHLEDDVYNGLERKILYSYTYPDDDMTGVNVNFSSDGQNWYMNSYPINAGKYHVAFSVSGNRNYVSTLAKDLTKTDWDVEVLKADPTKDLFFYDGSQSFTYDGSSKEANVVFIDTIQGSTNKLTGLGDFSVKYSKDGGDWTDEKPLNAGTYKVGVVTTGGDNFNPTGTGVVLTDDNWTLKIEQIDASEDLFEIAGNEYTYDGQSKTVTVKEKDNKKEFEGKTKIKYYYEKDGAGDWYEEGPVDAGEYRLKLEINDAENYKDTTIELSDDSKLKINRETPDASMFNFIANDVSYDGEIKEAQVDFNERYDSNFPEVIHTGMGERTIHYYKNSDHTDEISKDNVKNAGTYYVGITVGSGKNYLPTENGSVLSKEDWRFNITKAVPTSELFEITNNEYTYDGQNKNVTVNEKDGKQEFKDKIKIKYYYEKEGTEDWYEDGPVDAGEYKVGLEIQNAENYLDKFIELSDGNKLRINKAQPSADLFRVFPMGDENYMIYDGFPKFAGCEKLGEGIGDTRVVFSSDGNSWDAVREIDAGMYHIGIEVYEGKNYTASAGVLTKEDWKFEILKAKPTADLFVCEVSDKVYDGESKEAEVKFTGKVHPVFPEFVSTGIGEISVHYYKNQECTDEVPKDNVKNAGTYYVGITVTDGKNYLATEQGEILKEENWKFTINKANPTLDFTIINGGTTGNDPQLQTEDKKEIFYGKILGNAANILPSSNVGTWSFKDPGQIMKPVGEQYIDLVFTPDDTENYDWSNVLGYDPSTEKLNVKLLVSTVVDKSDWGDKVEVDNNGTVNYVDNKDGSPNKGSTSVEITGDGIHWVKETSYDVELGRETSAWYGIDNSGGVFERGSRFLIRWINKAENPEEWNLYNKGIDKEEIQNMPDKKKWIFVAEVVHPDGKTRYEQLNQPVPLYVQLGEDWDAGDVDAYFISQKGMDQQLAKEYIGNMECPEGKKEFFKLELLHFSPYTIYDVDPVSSNGDESQNLIPNNNGGSDNETKDADTSENYSESEKPDNSGTDGQNSKDYEGNERSDDSKDNTQVNAKSSVNSWYIVAGGSLLLTALLLGWWLLYKKHKKEKDVIRKSFFASLASSARN